MTAICLQSYYLKCRPKLSSYCSLKVTLAVHIRLYICYQRRNGYYTPFSFLPTKQVQNIKQKLSLVPKYKTKIVSRTKITRQPHSYAPKSIMTYEDAGTLNLCYQHTAVEDLCSPLHIVINKTD